MQKKLLQICSESLKNPLGPKKAINKYCEKNMLKKKELLRICSEPLNDMFTLRTTQKEYTENKMIKKNLQICSKPLKNSPNNLKEQQSLKKIFKKK